MRCGRCGNEIVHVPEHLRGLAEWVCQQCISTAPRRLVADVREEPISRQFGHRRGRKAA